VTQRDEASSHLDLRKPCVPTTKAENSHVGWCMAQESMMFYVFMMMIEAKKLILFAGNMEVVACQALRSAPI